MTGSQAAAAAQPPRVEVEVDAAVEALDRINHIVVLMLENRSFDHMLGYLYPGNVTPAGQPFEGLTGRESNADADGNLVEVFRIEPDTPNAYFMPGADPGEGYMATNVQLYGGIDGPSSDAIDHTGKRESSAATGPWARSVAVSGSAAMRHVSRSFSAISRAVANSAPRPAPDRRSGTAGSWC